MMKISLTKLSKRSEDLEDQPSINWLITEKNALFMMKLGM